MSPLHQDYFAPSFKMNVKIDFNDEIELDCLKKKSQLLHIGFLALILGCYSNCFSHFTH